MGSDSELLAAAESAAVHWSGDVAVLEPLLVSENAVFKVETTDGERFVLRLHRPGYNTPDEMRSELQWVQALHEAGVPVARPRPTLDGAFHVPVVVTAAETRLTGAVEWVEGEPLGRLLAADHRLLGEAFGAAGELAARLRRQSMDWELPVNFVRRRWDADGLLGDNPLWGRFWDAAALAPEHRRAALAARDRLRELLASLSTDADSFGLIHADLHVNNILRTDDDYVVIDFDDAGFGWYLWDVAVAFQSLAHTDPAAAVEQAGRDAFVQGYRSVHRLTDDEIHVADALCIARGLSIIGWMDARPEVVPAPVAQSFARSAVARAERWLDT